MSSENQNTKFTLEVKHLKSDYGSDIDEELIEVGTQEQPGDDTTDYGSDLDSDGQEIVSQIFASFEGTANQVLEPIEEYATRESLVRIPVLSNQGSRRSTATERSSYHTASEGWQKEETENLDKRVSHSDLAQRADVQESLVEVKVGKEEVEQPRGADKRTPIERFRKPPKKPLSVTDIVSPAWCELQYWFSLTKHGKVKRTPAMKQGSRVHKVLEEQVHTFVPVETKTKEDTYGLRIWNIIQGLRTLRATGRTREVEVWGVVDGEVVNGVLDELSYTCPDPEMEEVMEQNRGLNDAVCTGQRSINAFYGAQAITNSWIGNPHTDRKVYVTDVKTRASKYMPTGAQLKGVQMQLMLYRQLLIALASNSVDADIIFARYSLNPHASFSPSFITNIADLDDNFIQDVRTSENFAAFNTEEDQWSELSQHYSLTRLWSLMIMEFQRTIPSPDAIGDILQAEYRRAKDGEIIGNQCFTYDRHALESYIIRTMEWWKGRREPQGVSIEEAFKCRVCEFAESCDWRKVKMEEAHLKAKEKRRVAGKKYEV